MIKKLAYKIVFNDLKKCGLFMGTYDAKNGNEHFMYGIETIMESIAYAISDETGDKFNTKFLKNMIESEKKC